MARRTVDAVVRLTEFSVATLTVREGSECRRVATAGLEDGRIGMTTPFSAWEPLLRPEWLIGTESFLIPPDAPALWADVPDIQPSDDPDAWTAQHGLIIPLRDADSEIAGFLSVDQPRSGRLPDSTTLDTLELFARQAQIAFVNARLYDLTRRQADIMSDLFEVAKAMAHTMDFEVVIPKIISALQRRLDPYVSVIVRRHGDVLDVWRTDRVKPDQITRHATRADGPLAPLLERVEAGEDLINLPDVDEWPELRDRLTPGSRSLCIAGTCDAGGLCVVLVVSSDRPHAFDDEAARFLRGVLDCTVATMRNAELYAEVRTAAERDALTGLRNRRVFWTVLSDAVAAASAEQPVAVAVIDVDNFKAVNDELGHEAGDRALRHVAKRLEANVRETDSAFRIGGEEFVLIMPDTDADSAVLVLQRVAAAVKTSRVALPELTISAGIATAPGHASTNDALFNAADAALYAAKRLGKDRTEVAPTP